jgi:hypothetical protein
MDRADRETTPAALGTYSSRLLMADSSVRW